jgi:hypothetical protein
MASRLARPHQSIIDNIKESNALRIFASTNGRESSTVEADRNRLVANNEVRAHSLHLSTRSRLGVSAEELFVELLAAYQSATMSTGVEQHPNDVVVAAHQYHRSACNGSRYIVAGARNF